MSLSRLGGQVEDGAARNVQISLCSTEEEKIKARVREQTLTCDEVSSNLRTALTRKNQDT